MFGKLGSLLKKRATPFANRVEDATLCPDQSFVAVGDVHGCYDELTRLIETVDQRFGRDIPLVFVGDYVDRGPKSKQVLAWLFEQQQNAERDVICLKGNHEQMMIEFIDDPAGNGTRWLRNGGIETLASFGINGVPARPDAEDALDLADKFEELLPDGLQDWLRNLPYQWNSGNILCVHAGMDPAKSPQDQSRRDMMWGHTAFFKTPREDGNWVVHGHTITPTPKTEDHRIAIDTGAFRTGLLTAAQISNGAVTFVQG